MRFVKGHKTPQVKVIPPPQKCACGCGGNTTVIKENQPRQGRIAGQRNRFLPGHTFKPNVPLFLSEDRGYKTPCWIWQLGTNGHGYGVKWDGIRLVGAHVWMYLIRGGVIPKGLDIDHLCRVPMCINPSHLEPVTRKENTRRGNRHKKKVAA